MRRSARTFGNFAFVLAIATTFVGCIDGPDEALGTASSAGAAGMSGAASAGANGNAGGGASNASAAATGASGGRAGRAGASGSSGTSGGSGASGSSGSSGATGNGGSSGSSGSSGAAGISGASSGSAGASGFSPASHDPFPVFTDKNGPVIAAPSIISVGYDAYPYEDDVKAWSKWVATSDWLTSVGADYGVGAGSYVGHFIIPGDPPLEIGDAEIQTLLVKQVAANVLPMPTANTIVMVYFPSSTVVFLSGETSCQNFGGYHGAVNDNALNFPYAVLPTCPAGQFGPTESEGVSVVASHELIESATNPYAYDSPAWELDTSMPSSAAWPWLGNEVGDVCAHQPIQDETFWVQRIWSVSQAALGADPCDPNPKHVPYFNASVVGDSVKNVMPGDTADFTLTGFSLEEVADWQIDSQPKIRDFDVQIELDATTLNNGRVVHLSAKVPANASSGSSSGFVLRSLRNGDTDDYTMWPMAVVVPN